MESKTMRIMSEKPLNAETPVESLRSWITANSVFFDRNQGEIPGEKISLEDWRLRVEGDVEAPLTLTIDEICRMPKAVVANTLECSGNSRSLLEEKAKGNPWTVGGVGNAVWGGVWLRDVLAQAGIRTGARHVAFEGFDSPLGSAKIQFIRSIPLDKAVSSTLLAYEMNGEPLPLKHGYPMRSLALGWTGANCIKWLRKITVLAQPYSGFYMDKVYRVFQKGQDPGTGTVVTGLKLKSIITQPVDGQQIASGTVTVLGAAYGGEAEVQTVEVSTDNGKTWSPADFIGPRDTYAWRLWQYLWQAGEKGKWTLMARATDNRGNKQPLQATWNVLGYGNNGVREHAVNVHII
jgi:DMSO/TMAO reductase YedYZ molybdopterin-dependent catalytic subunit